MARWNHQLAGDLTLAEHSFLAAFRAGDVWTPQVFQTWCRAHPDLIAQTPMQTLPTGPLLLRGTFLRALIIVDGALVRGITPPAAQVQWLDRHGIDPAGLSNVRGIEVDWPGAEMRPVVVCTDGPEDSPYLDLRAVAYPKGIDLRGCSFQDTDGQDADLNLEKAHIRALDLSFTKFRCLHGIGLTLDYDFEGLDLRAHLINMVKAHIKGGLYLSGTRLKGQEGIALSCDVATIGGSVHLREGFKAQGEVNFVGAQIDGAFECDAGEFTAGDNGLALHCNGAKIGGHVFLRAEFKALGAVNFVTAQIGGQLSCEDGEFTAGKSGLALVCNGAKIGKSVFLRERFQAQGEVNFGGAQIGGQLVCSGGQFTAGDNGTALQCNGATIGDSVFLVKDFKAQGEVNFGSAQIGGMFECDGGEFTAGKSGLALVCNGAKIGKSVFLRKRFQAQGGVDFGGAQIGDQLDCSVGQFTAGGNGLALDCNGANIDHSVFLSEGFKAQGEVNFVNAQIGGQLNCRAGEFTSIKRGLALNCNGATIGDSVFLTRVFKAQGEVNFVGAQIGGQLICWGGQFTAGYSFVALQCYGAKIGDSVFLSHVFLAQGGVNFRSARIGGALFIEDGLITAPPQAAHDTEPPKHRWLLDLSQASCEVFHDAQLAQSITECWLGGYLRLDGFRYQRLGENAPKTAKNRLKWLKRQIPADAQGREFKPQPYEQLSKVLREMGHTSDARTIALSKQYRMHRSGNLSWPDGLFRWLVLWPTGYGYRPQYPFFFGVVMMVLSLGIFEAAYRAGYMAPAQPHAAISEILQGVDYIGQGGGTAPATACALIEQADIVPPFNSVAYVIDTFIPLIDLDQESSWKPTDQNRFATASGASLDPCQDELAALNPPPPWWSIPLVKGPAHYVATSWGPAGGLYWLKWALMSMGFAISAVIAASLSGLMRKD
ncbi:hypothetical protein [Woodsholea maritima]|uniref:hypothetical protein n=1 Tax=Woodsholea maritima TaxID=240237 RepID=UPI00037DBA07|nr:hypothetical protein [Woodsholea maritima]